MRVKNEIENLNYTDTQLFFKHRAEKYNTGNPYSVTMYQDGNPELVKQRNEKEMNKLLPLLGLSDESKVLDVACGIGRWSDAIDTPIAEYCGIDFSKELIEIATNRNKELGNRHFYVGQVKDTNKLLTENNRGKYTVALFVGILMYINDDDIAQSIGSVLDSMEEQSVICVREPVGINDRLTLKDFYSDELSDNYNAIYRTRNELEHLFEEQIISKGYKLTQSGFLFDEDSMNNRKETVQYYYIFER